MVMTKKGLVIGPLSHFFNFPNFPTIQILHAPYAGPFSWGWYSKK